MRPVLLLAFMLLPWAGCVTPGTGDLPLATTIGRLFEYQAVERGDPTPEPIVDCAALLGVLNQRALDHSRVMLEQSVENGGYGWGYHAWRGGTMTVMAASAAMDTAGAGASLASSEAQVTGTNNQEAAADEADIVKTDGEWTYVLQGQILRVLRSPNVGDLEAYAEVKLDGVWGGELLLERRDPANPADDRLVIVAQKSSPMPAADDARVASGASLSIAPWGHHRWSAQTHVTVLSLADRAKPQVIHDLAVEGHPVGARLVDGHAHVVVHAGDAGLPLQTGVWMDEPALQRFGLDWESYYEDANETERKGMLAQLAREADARNVRAIANLTLADHLPVVARDGLPTQPKAGCHPLLQVDGGKGRGVTTILSLDVAGGKVLDRSVQMLGASSVLYASGDALVLTAPTQESWWYWVQPDLLEATDLHWFTLDGLDVRHLASGRVAGQVLDSFSLDVHDGRLRVATTTGQWSRGWLPDPEPMTSHLAVFDAVGGQLVLAGMVGGLAPGERIWSARFTDTRAYIVTFRQTDPLWVIDLAGVQPVVLGELHIPGVSTYLHPLDGDAVLAVGIGPRGEEGLDWGRVQVSLFDVSDPANPKRADVLDIAPEGGYAWSTAVHEHKAFTYWAAVGKLALPLSVAGRATLQLVEVDRGRMSLYPGGVLTQAAVEQPHGWNSIERSWFLGVPEKGIVSVYTLGQAGATAHDLATLKLQSAVAFPHQEPGYVLYD